MTIETPKPGERFNEDRLYPGIKYTIIKSDGKKHTGIFAHINQAIEYAEENNGVSIVNEYIFVFRNEMGKWNIQPASRFIASDTIPESVGSNPRRFGGFKRASDTR